MQLDYKVLFVDDDGFDGFMGTLRNALNDHLQKNGFVLNGIEVKNEPELDSQISKEIDYDMIFVDNRFDDKECGIDFIKKIRNAKIYADVILCTALSDNTLRESINIDTALHGFYYLRKDNLFQHANNIIDFRFRKELDTNVMRGIAMSEVAKFDNQILTILLKDDSNKQKIIAKIKDNIEIRYKKSQKVSDEEIWQNVSDPDKSTLYFESALRKDYLHSHVLKDIEMLKKCYDAIKDKYGIDVLKKRNILAHQIDPTLSDDEKKQLRIDLIEFRRIFDQISNHFNCDRQDLI
jgi:response regulator of citrate/malate metabolism